MLYHFSISATLTTRKINGTIEIFACLVPEPGVEPTVEVTMTEMGCRYSLTCDPNQWNFLTYVYQIPPDSPMCSDGELESQEQDLADLVCDQATGALARPSDGAVLVAILCNFP